MSKAVIQAGWNDVPHLDEKTKMELAESFPLHEREARMNGVPVLGSGKVYPVDEASIVCAPFALPAFWPRIVGLDFGWDHPAAAAWLAWDRDTDTVYVYDTFRVRETSVAMQAPLIAARGKWMPVAWPHDGLQHDKGSGDQLAGQYKTLGVNMLPERATFEDGSNGVEAGISDILIRMQTGRFKVFSTCGDWLEEWRLYHRKNGIIVKLRDDLQSATRYGVMMLRFAITEPKASTLGTGSNYAGRRAGY